jgi:hypothetical protein
MREPLKVWSQHALSRWQQDFSSDAPLTTAADNSALEPRKYDVDPVLIAGRREACGVPPHFPSRRSMKVYDGNGNIEPK